MRARTTVRLDEELLARAKRLAAETGRTLTEVLEDALRVAVHPPPRRSKREPVRLTTVDGPALPGVNLDDSSALLDLMEFEQEPRAARPGSRKVRTK